jgi:hypothetical protein
MQDVPRNHPVYRKNIEGLEDVGEGETHTQGLRKRGFITMK